ncbi:DNA topology modulation protein [Halobacillus litoralis]|uniref:DNA topology modulation protein n=1 Tax=Halobacillus litoralis TaxID=45668 RepID=UPI001CD78DD3|nr:DNA topology modulation protein [Halobacillus litoralis]MCA0970240.1 DNA topology modulation protein [Halobacillus litoralis]
MKRIAVIGPAGSGKSTLSRELSEKTGIAVYHLDSLHWRPGWEAVSKEEQRSIQNGIISQNSWIIDGNYGGTLDVRLTAADTIVFMDVPRRVCLYRIIKRYVQYRNRTRPDMAEGCPERISFQLLKWVWQYRKKKRPEIMERLRSCSLEREVVVLKSTRGVSSFLSQITD